jgi:hypothetical protein
MDLKIIILSKNVTVKSKEFRPYDFTYTRVANYSLLSRLAIASGCGKQGLAVKKGFQSTEDFGSSEYIHISKLIKLYNLNLYGLLKIKLYSSKAVKN